MSTSDLIKSLLRATKETLIMVGIASSIAIILGTIIGLILYITANPLLNKNKTINFISGVIINIIRSIPFIILLVLLVPVTNKLVGSTTGPLAASVPLTVASIAFFARLVDGALAEIDPGVIEASVAMGANLREIIFNVLLVEALPGIIRAITVTLISVIGFSAMAGTVGGGGIGDLAIRFGYYRYQTDIMFITVVLLIVVVQVLQGTGEKLAVKVTKK
jgi:D-methionine transport system permease protein